MGSPIRVLVWNECRHEKVHEAVREVYPDGIHAAIAGHLGKQQGMDVRTATLDDPEHGLAEEVLSSTDVLIWWGHMAHNEVSDEVAGRAHTRVLEGMGLIALHSSQDSKILKRVLGTTCCVHWREAGEKERLWNIEPGHPITEGIGDYFELPHVEMYGERFDVPDPDKLIFISWFEGGEVFRSGCVWERGHGRVFYFRPGHETFPIYYDQNVMRVLANATRWAAPRIWKKQESPHVEPIEPLPQR
jgi:trehalose utilization protein